MDRVDAVVVGAGVVGLAVARALARSGREVMVLEAAGQVGSGISSRNSEVIHAGLYYPTGSHKARLCVAGNRALHAYCMARGVAHRRCGKLVVATDASQLPALQALAEQARLNGVHDLVWLTQAQAQALEPALACQAALLSPSTGIVDAHGLMLALQGDLEHAGGLVALHASVDRLSVRADGIAVHAAGMALLARSVVNAAGLSAPALAARTQGLAVQHVPTAHFAKGNYFTLAGRSPFTRLIYPLPQAAGLGVHLTLDLGGQAKFGPDVQWIEPTSVDAIDYTVDARRGEAFYAEVRRYWPDLPDGALLPGYAGVRPKLQAPHEAARDFVIQGPPVHGVPGLVNLLGIESPGLTGALALADEVANLLELSI